MSFLICFTSLSTIGYVFYLKLIISYNKSFSFALLFQILRDICLWYLDRDPQIDIHYKINTGYYFWGIFQILMMCSLGLATFSFNYFFTAFYCSINAIVYTVILTYYAILKIKTTNYNISIVLTGMDFLTLLFPIEIIY